MGVVQNQSSNFRYLSIKAGPSMNELNPGLYDSKTKEKIGAGYSGELLAMRHETWKDKREKTQHAFKLIIDGSENKDRSEIAVIRINFNMMSMSLINTLSKASEDKGALFANTEITLNAYQKDGYAKLWIEIDGEKGDWLYDWDKVKKYKEDPEKWAAMMKKHINANLPENFELGEDEPVMAGVAESKNGPVDDDSDLPF